MKLHKLTTQDNKTRRGCFNETLWGEGVSHSGTGEGELCSEGWIHAYTDPFLAVIMNPVHANIHNPKLWEAEGEVVKNDKGLKVGCKTLTTLEEIPLPVVTREQRIVFAILCAREVYSGKEWNECADSVLSDPYNIDRKAAKNAATYAAYATRAATYAYDAARAVSYASNAKELDFYKIIQETYKICPQGEPS